MKSSFLPFRVQVGITTPYLPFRIQVGISILFLILIGSVFYSFLSEQDPQKMELSQRFASPSTQHWMGTDQNGLDVFSHIMHGAQVSLSLSTAVVLICLLLGLFLGSLAGYYGGWVDLLLMNLINTLNAFPGFLLILAVAAVLQTTSLLQLILVLCLTGWTGYARMVRGEVLHLKEKEYVQSAEALGASTLRKVIVHIGPGLIGPLSVQASFAMAMTIMTESALSFLGIGVPPSYPTWGSLLNSGRHYMLEAPHLSLFAGLFLFLTVMSFNLIGDGLRDFFNHT